MRSSFSFETGILPWKNNAKAALTITFDGGYRTTYELGMEALSQHKMKATWFVVVGSVGSTLEGRPMATWSDWKKASLLGMEIASHTVTHPTLALSFAKESLKLGNLIYSKSWRVLALNNIGQARKTISSIYKQNCRGVTSSQIMIEAVQSKEVIETQIKSQRVLSFAYPGGRYNSALKRNLKGAGYLSARSTDEGYNFPNSIDLYALKSKVWNATVDMNKANKWVDFALNKHAWLIETYHVLSLDGKTGYRYDTAISQFKSHLDYISLHDIWVDTQQNITKYLMQRKATKIKLEQCSRGLIISTENSLDPTIFNQALTFRTFIPTTWPRVRITQAQNVQEVLPAEENSKHYILYDVLPNNGEITLTPVYT